MDAIDQTIDNHIAAGHAFAAWIRPGEQQIHYALQRQGRPHELAAISELTGKRGFVMAPFQLSEAHPIVVLEPEEQGEWAAPAQDEAGNRAISTVESARPTPAADYAQRFALFTQPLHHHPERKLVLSRKQSVPRLAEFSVGKSFLAAVARYIRSFVYLCHTPQTGTWMGSTPEILLSGERHNWHTVALAGTQPLRDGKVEEQWDPKNRQEQQLVARYIHEQLRTLGIEGDEQGPYPVRAGEVCHLKSDFFFSLSDPSQIGKLLARLHPTPAVCGLPKAWALRFIQAEEGYDRAYYSGFVGWLDPQGHSDLYVNLRCMQIKPTHFELYAGGGLLEASQLAEEWQETEIKMDTMRRLLHPTC